MADLSAYKDLSKAPLSFGDDEPAISALSSDAGFGSLSQGLTPTQHFVQEVSAQEVDTEFSGNVKTLIRLVNELPEGVTKQTGAQIIRLTMEAMGISMENVLSEAQSAQSEMLDAVRANIKKIEEYKTVIRKLETDIKYYQGKANELSEIIDLFILSNTSSGQKVPFPDDLAR
jgi:SpoVK/Ycf46/Vps4 family AAA+-type ATPase